MYGWLGSKLASAHPPRWFPGIQHAFARTRFVLWRVPVGGPFPKYCRSSREARRGVVRFRERRPVCGGPEYGSIRPRGYAI